MHYAVLSALYMGHAMTSVDYNSQVLTYTYSLGNTENVFKYFTGDFKVFRAHARKKNLY